MAELWITQRLANRLVRALVAHLEVVPVPHHVVAIAVLPDGLQLTFRPKGHDGLALALNATVLRQWLTIVQQNYRQAEWPYEDVWPEGFNKAAAARQMQAGVVLLH